MLDDARDDAGVDRAGQDEPADSDRDYALAFADLIQNEVTRLFEANAAVEPHAWILARRDPLTKAMYPDAHFGLFVHKMGALVSEASLDQELAAVRELAEHAAAIGVALVVKVRIQVLPRGSDSDAALAVTELLAGRELVFLGIEHRALSEPRYRVASLPAPTNGRPSVVWVPVDASNAAFGHNRQALPSLLPPLN